jgi:hemerythrin-like domain-containing protein
MEGKQISFGTTGFEELLEKLRDASEPQDIAWLAERYIEILRAHAQTEDQE